MTTITASCSRGARYNGINGRKIFDTWYRNRNLLANGRLDPRPVITDVMMLDDFDQGFGKMIERPRKSAKIVLFPDKEEYQAAAKRMGSSSRTP